MPTSEKPKAGGKTATASIPPEFMAMTPAAAQAWLDIMTDSARFLTDRLQQDFETQKAMLACKSPTDLLQVQAAFFNSAMTQYTDFAARLFSKVSATAEDSVKGARTGSARRYDDVPV